MPKKGKNGKNARKGGYRIPDDLRFRRHEILDKKIGEGVKRPAELAKSVRGLSAFRGIRHSSLLSFIERYLKAREKIAKESLPRKAFEKLIGPLRREWIRLLAATERLEEEIDRLEGELKKWHDHRCPPADAVLVRENQKLRETIEVLSRHRPLGPSHLVTHSD